MPEHCAYCGVEGGDLRPCEMCNRLVCWHPTCRNGKNKKTVCCTCAGKLPETSEGNEDWSNGKCPICEEKMEFIGPSSVSMVGPKGKNRSVLWSPKRSPTTVAAYTCSTGHVVLAMDYGNSQRLKKGG